MTRRERDIILLLGSLADAPFAQPKSWTPELVRRNAVRGEVPSHRVVCPACNGERRRRVRTVLVPCDRCLGAGGTPLGYIVVDGMIDERYRRKIATAETGLEAQYKVVACDSCAGAGRYGNGYVCRYCRGGGVQEIRLERWRATRTLTVEMEIREPVSDAVLAAMDARERAGHYDQLLEALAEMHSRWASIYRAVWKVWVKREFPVAAFPVECEIGLTFLERNLPDPLKVPAGVRQRAKRVEEAA